MSTPTERSPAVGQYDPHNETIDAPDDDQDAPAVEEAAAPAADTAEVEGPDPMAMRPADE